MLRIWQFELAKDRSEMSVDSALRKHELGRYSGVAQPGGQQPQDLPLAPGQPGSDGVGGGAPATREAATNGSQRPRHSKADQQDDRPTVTAESARLDSKT